MSLAVENLYKKFGEKIAVDRLSFNAKEGKAFGLLGRNGAGKTTTIRMILDVIKKDDGSILWNGKDIRDSDIRIGYLPEERGLYPKSKVSDQLIYLSSLRGIGKRAAIDSLKYWLERFGIADYYNSRVETLSKGNQQKIQLIAAILHDPNLIILDEPFSGLDPVNAELLKSVVEELIEKKKTLIFSSHRMEYVEEFCEDILLLKYGKAILKGNLAEIKRSYGHRNIQIRTDANIEAFLKENAVESVKRSSDRYSFKVKEKNEAQRLLEKLVAEKINLIKFEIMEPSLHEIFLEKAGD